MIHEKKGGLKEAVKTVTTARKDRPLITSTLKGYTLQLLLQLTKRGFLEKKGNQWAATPEADVLIADIGKPEGSLLRRYCTPARCSSISVSVKLSVLLLCLIGYLTGGSFSLLAAAVILLLDTSITLHPLYVSEKSDRSRWSTKLLLAFLSAALLGLTIPGMITPLPLSRNWISLGFLLFVSILTLAITQFQLVAPSKKKKKFRFAYYIFVAGMMFALLVRGTISPLPVPDSGLTFTVSLLTSSLFFLLFLYQKMTGRAFTAFSLIYLSQSSLRFIIILLITAAAALLSYSGIYHLDYLSLVATGVVLYSSIFRILNIAESRNNRRNPIELWLEGQAKSARKHFFFIWVHNLLKEQPAAKSEILAEHARNYERKKAGLHKNVHVFLDRDGFLAEHLDLYLSNLLFDRKIIIEKDRFTVPVDKKRN